MKPEEVYVIYFKFCDNLTLLFLRIKTANPETIIALNYLASQSSSKLLSQLGELSFKWTDSLVILPDIRKLK
jgi:hypothetical protein